MKKLLIMLAVALLSACASTKPVFTDINRSAMFSEYRTFTMPETVQKREDAKEENFNQMASERLSQAIRSEMRGRGYQEDGLDPDLLVTFSLRVDKNINYRTRPSMWNPWLGDVESFYDTESTLVINMVDVKTQKLVWQGYITDSWHRKPEKRDQKLREGISRIFAEYPFRAGRSVSASN